MIIHSSLTSCFVFRWSLSKSSKSMQWLSLLFITWNRKKKFKSFFSSHKPYHSACTMRLSHHIFVFIYYHQGPSASLIPSWNFIFKLRSEEHTSELQSHSDLVCRLLLEKKKKKKRINTNHKNITSNKHK